MEIRTQEETIRDVVGTTSRVRLDMRRLQHRKCSFASHGAPPIVGVGHDNAECALTQAGSHCLRCTIACAFERSLGGPTPLKPIDDRCPDPCTLALGQVLSAADLGLWTPVTWLWNPVGLVEERRLSKDDATDLVVAARLSSLPSPSAVRFNPGTHVLFGYSTVLRLKGGPGQTRRQDRKMHEEAYAGDGVVWSLQPEEERFARGQSPEGCATRAPEVHFVEIRPAGKEAIPLEISVGDPRQHVLGEGLAPVRRHTPTAQTAPRPAPAPFELPSPACPAGSRASEGCA